MTAGKNWIKHIQKAQYSTLQHLLMMIKTENGKPLLLQWTCPNGGKPDQVPPINLQMLGNLVLHAEGFVWHLTISSDEPNLSPTHVNTSYM